MKNLVGKISQYKKRIFGVGVGLALFAATTYIIENSLKSPEYDFDCEFYRGVHRNKYDGDNTYVFDSEKREQREERIYDPKTGNMSVTVKRDPKHKLIGDISFENFLKLNKKYCFTFEKPRWPWSSEKLVDFRLDHTIKSVNLTQNLEVN